MRVLERPFPIPVRWFVLFVFGGLGVVSVVLLVVSLTSDAPPLVFAAFYAFVWAWNVCWWGWVSPYRIEVGDDRAFEFVTVLGRRTTVPGATIRSLTMSWTMVPVLRHDHGRVLLLPHAPTEQLVTLLRSEYPSVEVKLPAWAKLP